MDRSYEISDSSDWLDTPVASLASVEAALRCQVCKDFYNTPMITSCSHTFCSLCIRRCLTSDGKCPSCRSPDQEIRLRRNWTVEELADAFRSARSAILQLGQDAQNSKGRGSKGKRKFEETQSRMSLRPQKANKGVSPDLLEPNDNSENADNSSYLSRTNTTDGPRAHCALDDGLSACPICGRRMKVEHVFSHLDIHQDEQRDGDNLTLELDASSKKLCPSRTNIAPKPLERLPSLSYSILNDSALRKKIAAQGLPNWGPRQLLIRRHTEWLNLWNANCDSVRSRSKQDLLQDLEMWERTQGGNAPPVQGSARSSNAIMAKDFDGVAWASSHSDDFRRLVAEARQKKSTGPIMRGGSRREQKEEEPEQSEHSL